jgi:2-polyprenyl-3-methyl-5-hydroxy-6-metoxy-1,4-benzoquinol methylase
MESLQSVHWKTRQAYNLAAQKYHDLFHDEMNQKERDRKVLDDFALRFTKGSLLCDAGCGPSGHIGRYLFDKGMRVIGVDIADRCIELARMHNPGMDFEQGDMAQSSFDAGSFDGIVSYYSIIHTPKCYMHDIFSEFYRILKPDGIVLIAVKAGTTEGYVTDLLGIETELYFAFFTKEEIAQYLDQAGFTLEYIEKRRPYDFEIDMERIYAIGRKQ